MSDPNDPNDMISKPATSRLQDVVEALDILTEYISNTDISIYAERSTINVHVVCKVPKERIERLEDLGFFWDEEIDCFYSFLDSVV